ncbi:MAG: SPOR domain-containing protein [Acidobacteriota bacterium]|nr:SPOR domain-containing protein [Acidobacteriota bacterium]
MATTQDDAFREIQLNGKQLVFMAMAFVVIAVGIFLMGVQVGRGVRGERGLPGGAEIAAAAAAETEPPLPPASVGQGSSETPVTAGEKLSYAERLTGNEGAADSLKRTPEPAPPAEPPAPKPEPVTAAPAPVAARKTPAPGAPAAAASTEPAGTGYAIQVAALRERSEADTMVKRLAGKGYPAYVLAPAQGAPSVYRVRVGKFKDRREADTVAARLQKEEQFKPWVVR